MIRLKILFSDVLLPRHLKIISLNYYWQKQTPILYFLFVPEIKNKQLTSYVRNHVSNFCDRVGELAFWYLCNLNLYNFYFFHRVEDLTKTWQDIVQDSTRGQGNQARKGRSFVAFYGSRINVAEMSGNYLVTI